MLVPGCQAVAGGQQGVKSRHPEWHRGHDECRDVTWNPLLTQHHRAIGRHQQGDAHMPTTAWSATSRQGGKV